MASFGDPFGVFSTDPFFRDFRNDPFFRSSAGFDRPFGGLLEVPPQISFGTTGTPSGLGGALTTTAGAAPGALTAGGRGGFGFMRNPRMDVTEISSGYEIKADLPGLNKDDVRVSIQDDLLTLEGERKEEREETDATRHLIERSFGKFSRSFRLPNDANPQQVKAAMEQGVLKLQVGKKEGAESGRKRIDIS